MAILKEFVRDHYVYGLFDQAGRMFYVGKGRGDRVAVSAKARAAARSEILQSGMDARESLDLESRLITLFGCHALQNERGERKSRQYGPQKAKDEMRAGAFQLVRFDTWQICDCARSWTGSIRLAVNDQLICRPELRSKTECGCRIRLEQFLREEPILENIYISHYRAIAK